jgi:hypothetical protein
MMLRNLLITAVCGLMALPTASIADDHGRPPPPPSYRHQGGHAQQHNGNGNHHGNDNDGGNRYYGYNGRYPYYSYGARYPHYNHGYAYPYPYYGQGHHHDNDDAFWAIGGLVLGAIIGSAAERSSAAHAAAVAPANAGQTCRDSIVYDSAGNPRVQRDCR